MNLLLIGIIISLIAALYILTKTALNMVKKKRIGVFMPFFVLGFGLCLSIGFMLYNFFWIAADIYLIVKFTSVVGIFFIIWGAIK